MEISKELLPSAVLAEAKRKIVEENAPCAFVRDGEIAKIGEGAGVQPLIRAWETEPETLRGAVVVDKIVGKAAAMLAALGGCAGVYGLTMSDAAAAYLAARGIPAGWDERTERIINRMGTGLCPMEETVLHMEEPREGLAALKATMARLRGEKPGV